MLLYIIILVEGFVTISLEILTIRQLIPMVGNNVIVTSFIIGIFLLFLAYGYRRGGCYEDNYIRRLKRNFILAAIGLGIGLSYTFIEMFFYLIDSLKNYSNFLPLILYLLIVISPIVYLLGQTVPITLNLWKKHPTLGKTGGQVLYLSTLGSFFGATLTALLFLNYFGVAWAIVIDFALLIFLAILLIDIRKEGAYLVTLILFTLCVYTFNVAFEKNMFLVTNNYGNYGVLPHSIDKNNYGKVLTINDSFSSYLNDKKQGFAYIEVMKKILFADLQQTNKNILVLGAGGFTLSAERTNGNHFTYVDVDKELMPITKKHFLQNINGNFIVDDARHYLLNNKHKHFEVIVIDAYSNRNSIVPHLLTREFFALVNAALTPDGIALFNVIARPTLDDIYSKRIDNTIRDVFANCMAQPMVYSQKPTNIVYVCKKSPAMHDKHLYTDNLNRSILDFSS